MKILLLGAAGQLGWELQRALAPLGRVCAATRAGPGLSVDMADAAALAALVREVAPQAIVNAAAYTAVDRAESEPALAHAVNAAAPALLAREAAARGVPLVHYSTDYVFDGSGDTSWREESPTGPLSMYGRTKLEGEDAIRASGGPHLIFRTSWVYAARGGNFARTMLRLAAEREQLRVIADQVGAPTGADLLADATAHALRALVADPARSGTYHLCAAGHTSWHAYARFVIDWARTQGLPVKVAPDGVQAITTAEYPTPARRPLNSRLDTSRVRQAFGLHLPPWQDGVQRMLTEAYSRAV